MFKKFQRNNFFKYEIFNMLFDKILYNVDLCEFFVSNRKFCLSLNICFFKVFFNSNFFYIYFIIAIYYFYLSIFFISALKKEILVIEILLIEFNFFNMTFDTTISDFLRYLIFKLYFENSDTHLINRLNQFFIVF